MQRLLRLVCLFLISFSKVHGQCSSFNPCGLQGGGTFREPEVLQSSNGSLEITLSVEMANLTFDWFTTIRRTYNGSVPGPTWRIRPGDNVTVTLVNNLETSIGLEPKKINELRFPNITNLHTHGLHISSKVPQDNVFIYVQPGESYTYQYQILEDQPAGTFWYHPHVHGSISLQILSGMAGMLIIEDPTTGPAAMPPHLADISCPDNCQHEVSILIQPLLTYSGSRLRRGFAQLQERYDDNVLFRKLEPTYQNTSLADWLTNANNGFSYLTINGEVFPKLTIPSGQRKRFRLVNSDGASTVEPTITDQNGNLPTDGCEVWEIAYDGIYLNQARKPILGRSFMNPSQRVDWIVICNEPGIYELRSLVDPLDKCSLGSIGRYNGLLATLVVTGDSQTPTAQEISLPKRPFYVGNFLDIPENEIYKEQFVIEASTAHYLNREKYSGSSNFRFKYPVGTIQEWQFTSTDASSGHPIHIHINHFQVVSYNSYTGPVSVRASGNPALYNQEGELCPIQFPGYTGGNGKFEGVTLTNGSTGCPSRSFTYVDYSIHSTQSVAGTIGYVSPGEFRDVIIVPPLSNITIRFMAHQFTGPVVIHCHNIFHGDDGMTMVVEIVEEDDDTFVDQSILSNLIGQCSSGFNLIKLSSGMFLLVNLNLLQMILYSSN